MGEEITSEATRTKTEMLQKAEEEVREKMAETAKRCADEEKRLEAATKETAKFIEVSQAIMRKHSEFLEKLEAARRSITPKVAAGQAAPEQAAARAGKAPKVAQQARVTPAEAPVKQAQPVQPVQPTQSPQPPVQAVPQVQPDQATRQISPVSPTVAENEIEIDDIAMQIGSAVERITEVEVTPVASQVAASAEVKPPVFDEPPASLFEDDDDSVRLYMPESELDETSPRPKFDFDDLKFGANFDTDD
jgi:hypothetical protein